VAVANELICLHTTQAGEVWCVESRGNPKIFCGLDWPQLRSGVYRVLGCPSNYELITRLYAASGDQVTVLVGSPAVCHQRQESVADVLSCVSVLNVHGSLINCWHPLNREMFYNYTLLRLWREADGPQRLPDNFGNHCTAKYFEFLGVEVLRFAIRMIAEIVDPRWFLGVTRPYRLSRLESYFGLKPAQFEAAWRTVQESSEAEAARAGRTRLLLGLVSSLRPDSCIHAEVRGIADEVQRIRKACQLVLGFIVRNWLEELGCTGYFNPAKFFQQVGNECSYLNKFKD